MTIQNEFFNTHPFVNNFSCREIFEAHSGIHAVNDIDIILISQIIGDLNDSRPIQ